MAQHLLAQQAKGGVGMLRRHEVAVDLVHQHEDVVPQTDLRHALQLLTGPYPAVGLWGLESTSTFTPEAALASISAKSKV